ncbi:MAG TPA: hypothetical protein VE134_02830, partial [Methanomicrobiales archaeon]|nr:hypothetical protein [Methanomicrobiales archaeon]
LGGTLWVLLLVSVGYFFGNIPVVQDNFEIFILAVIGLVIVTVAIILREVYRTARASSVIGEQ